MQFSQYRMSIDELCAFEPIVEHDHYFAAQALVATTQKEHGNAKYCLSRIQNSELREQAEYLIDRFKKGDGVTTKLLSTAAAYHGAHFLASIDVEPEEMLDFLEEDLEEAAECPPDYFFGGCLTRAG